jgi:hypothetical protein
VNSSETCTKCRPNCTGCGPLSRTTIPWKLSSDVLGNKKGKHTIYAALAKNNNVLYNTKAATFVFTIK